MTSCLQCGHKDPAEFLFCPRCGTKAVEGSIATDPLLGRILNGKYRVETQIGIGAMGTVYLGEHIGLKKRVALKVLHSDLQVSDESLQRFQREGIAAGKFNHPHLIQIFDFDRAAQGGGRVFFFLAMEFVEGVNLTLFMRQRGRLPLEMAVRLARQMLSCLAEAHRHGIVHRDLKPDNLMVTEASRGELRLKVLDFGLSKLVDRRLGSSVMTQPGRLLGTPLYMAPEQVSGQEADERSDVYAAGLILYEMLAGERPFRERDASQLFLTRPTAEAPSLRANVPDVDVPDALEELIARALAREREQRYQSAEEMLGALDELALAGASSSGLRSSTGTRRPAASPTARGPAKAASPPPPPRGKRWLLALAAGAGLGALGIAIVRGSAGGGRPARVRMVEAAERNEQEARYLGLLDEARLKLLASDAQAALVAVNQAFVLDCRDAEAFLVRAEIYRARGDLDTALADFQEAAEGDAGFVEPLLGMGWIQLERGDHAAAERSFAAAAESAPDNAGVQAARGALEWKRGNSAQAAELLDRAVRQDPRCAAAQLYLGRLRLDRGDGPAAIAALIEAKRNDAFSTRALAWLAEAYVGADDLEQADVQLEQALRLEPMSAELRIQRGALLLRRGRGGDALDFLKSSTERMPQSGKLWILRGLAEHEHGDVVAACEALRRGFEQGVRDPEARCLLGALYQRQERLDEASAQYQAVLQEEGEYPLANLNLGLVLVARGDYTGAAERLERVLAFDGENLVAHLFLGQLYKDYLGDDAKALECLERYADLGGDDPRVGDWLEELR